MGTKTNDVLIDSSAWIQLLRSKGDPIVRDRVRQLIIDDRAVWCDVVQLELWRGPSTDADRKTLKQLQAEIRSLDMTADVWQKTFEIASKCRPTGVIVPTTDLMIYACATWYDVELFHRDKHFDLLTEL